jgi:hypothetical protein
MQDGECAVLAGGPDGDTITCLQVCYYCGSIVSKTVFNEGYAKESQAHRE